MNDVRQDARTLDDPVPGVEQELLSPWPIATSGPNAVPPDHFGADRDVLADMDRWSACRPGSVQCTVAGRVHCYAYTWTDFPQLSDSNKPRYLQFLCFLGYRNGYSGCEGLPDHLQPSSVLGQSATLEVASPRALGPSNPLLNLYLQREEDRRGRAVKYTCVGPGQTEPVCCVVGDFKYQFGCDSLSIPETACNRCDISRDGLALRSYSKFCYQGVKPTFSEPRKEIIDATRTPVF